MSNAKYTLRASGLKGRFVWGYLLALAVYAAALAGSIAVLRAFCHTLRWYPDDPVYQVLHWCEDYLPLAGGMAFFAGAVLIGLWFLLRAVRCLDAVVAAAGRLAAPTEEPLVLPPMLRPVEDGLNLAREQALRAALLAKEADQRKNDLVVYLAHDLKTPLTSVIGYLTLLRDEPQLPAATRARYTGIALDKAERLETLINEFFDITRFSLTALTLEPEQLDLTRMLEQTVSEFEPILAEKGLRWRAQLEPGVTLLCDADKLARVFDNLIRNAAAYATPGTEVRLDMRRAGDSVRITLTNQGRTIPPEKLAHIFEQFFRLDPSRSSSTGGAGLGLAIAKEIVELHGGRIAAESADGHITFTVTLPVRKS